MSRTERRVGVIFSPTRPPAIGVEIARRFVAAGLEVVCVDHVKPGGDPQSTHVGDSVLLDSLVAEIRAKGGSIRTVLTDVSQRGEPERAVARVVAEAGRIDVAAIMNGATGAWAGSGALLDVSDDEAYRAVEFNLIVPLLLGKAVARQMVKQGGGGSIVYQSSHSGVVPSPRTGAFGAARAGLNFFVKTFATEVGRHGIRVNAANPLGIVPGGDLSKNPGIERLVRDSGLSTAEKFRQMIPLGRPQSPDETAAVMVFLALEATFVSGEAWTVAGGSVRA